MGLIINLGNLIAKLMGKFLGLLILPWGKNFPMGFGGVLSTFEGGQKSPNFWGREWAFKGG